MLSHRWLSRRAEGELICPSWLSDVISADSWAGLCVTGYFQWPQCECTHCVSLCVLFVRLDWNGRMCHRFSFWECEAMGYLVLPVCLSVHLPFGRSVFVFYSLLTSLGDAMSQLSSTSLPFLVIVTTLSRAGSVDKVTITRYLLCD